MNIAAVESSREIARKALTALQSQGFRPIEVDPESYTEADGPIDVHNVDAALGALGAFGGTVTVKTRDGRRSWVRFVYGESTRAVIAACGDSIREVVNA